MPYRYLVLTQEDANNKPTAAQAYQVGGATTGHQTFIAAGVADDDSLLIMAQEVDGDGNPSGAWEFVTVIYSTGETPDQLQSRTLIDSSTGALIDWSAAGVDATPRLTLVNAPTGVRRLHSTGTLSTDTYITIGGATNPFVLGKDYQISAMGLKPSVDGITVRAEAYIGSGWEIGSTSYVSFSVLGALPSGSTAITANQAAYMWIGQTGLGFGNSDAGGGEERVNINFRIDDPMLDQATSHVYGSWSGNWFANGSKIHGLDNWHINLPEPVKGLRFYPSGGNWESGSYYCWEYDRGYT